MKPAVKLNCTMVVFILLIVSPGMLYSKAAEIPFPNALRSADIIVDRLDNIIDYALIVGNGDINALVYSKNGHICMMLTKNDVWDARLDSKLDPPIPTIDLIKNQAGQFPKNEILPEGSNSINKPPALPVRNYKALPFPAYIC